MSNLFTSETPEEVKNAKVSIEQLHEECHEAKEACQGLHLLTMSTPNGQKVQIMLEELAELYGTAWTTTLMYRLTLDVVKDHSGC